jgi:CRP-like cAMP-binding protein
MRPGDVLYREGDEGCDFLVVLESKMAILEGLGDAGRVVAVHGCRTGGSTSSGTRRRRRC